MMNEQIKGLQAICDAHNEEFRSILKQYRTKFEAVILQVCETTGAQIERLAVSPECDSGIRVTFELGFVNPNLKKFNFGSSIDLYYVTGPRGLEVNYGTCGTWSLKDDEYQRARALLIAYLVNNIEQINRDLAAIDVSFVRLKELQKEIWNIERDIAAIEKKETEAKREELLNSIEVGSTACYTDDVSRYVEKLFKLSRTYYGIIEAITDKKVKIRKPDGTRNLVDKNRFAHHVQKGYILINGETRA